LSADQISYWYQLIWSANQLILSDQIILFDQDTYSNQLIWLI